VKVFLLKESRTDKAWLFGSAVVASVGSCFEKKIPSPALPCRSYAAANEEQLIRAQFTAKPV
jgi:hypothetical protein